MNLVTLPDEAQRALNEAARNTPRPGVKTKIFITVPNMCWINTGLVAKLFAFATQKKFDPWFHFLTEKRHHDYARNVLGKAFMESGADYMLMIDADVDPNPKILEMADLDKDIIAGNVFCWISGELMSSIWQLAECEQCRNLKLWMEEGKVHDPNQYRFTDKALDRWNPFSQRYEMFANKDGIFPDLQCRCKGTGMDPFVFRTHQSLKPQVMQVDSVGGAATMIARRVFEKTPYPWFQFLYRESREILLTEDHFFCWKAQQEGFKVWADPRQICSHYKLVDILQIQGPLEKAFKLGKSKAQAEFEQVKQSIIVPEQEIAQVAQ